jgi:1-acyl-sn-glycerol-3-phosphate acyltransferase
MDEHKAIFDTTGKLWAKIWLSLTMSYPTMSGNTIPSLLQSSSSSSISSFNTNTTACLYVANHASRLDIPILCTVLDPVFKFIAKGELRNVPGIGQQLLGVCGVRRFIARLLCLFAFFCWLWLYRDSTG